MLWFVFIKCVLAYQPLNTLPIAYEDDVDDVHEILVLWIPGIESIFAECSRVVGRVAVVGVARGTHTHAHSTRTLAQLYVHTWTHHQVRSSVMICRLHNNIVWIKHERETHVCLWIWCSVCKLVDGLLYNAKSVTKKRTPMRSCSCMWRQCDKPTLQLYWLQQ